MNEVRKRVTQYYFYVDGVLMPVTPTAVQMTVKNKNKTYTLADGGEVNVIQPPGLTAISFDLLLPATVYPFARYAGSFRDPGYFLSHFERLKRAGKPFELLIIRTVTSNLALKFAAGTLPYSQDIAAAVTGGRSDKIRASDARILLQNEENGSASYISDTTMTVTLEDYSVTEDAEKYGRDFYVSLRFLQYNASKNKTIVLREVK